MGKVLMILALTGLAACSGGRGVSGPVGSACLGGGRGAATPVLCSCVQGVADQTLSASDQRRAATFFDDPDKAQETRAADDSASEAFWARYRAFADAAERVCA